MEILALFFVYFEFIAQGEPILLMLLSLSFICFNRRKINLNNQDLDEFGVCFNSPSKYEHLEMVNMKNEVSNFYNNKWQYVLKHAGDSLHSHIGGQTATEDIINILKIDERDRLLDIGCGYGGLLMTATEKKKCKGIGVDVINQRIEKAKKISKLKGLGSDIEFINEDFMNWNYSAENKFSKIVIEDVLIHIENRLGLLSKAANYLGDNGLLLISDYFLKAEFKSDLMIFNDPAVKKPSPKKIFLDYLEKKGLELIFERDDTYKARDETKSLLSSMKNEDFDTVKKNNSFRLAINEVEEWNYLFDKRFISYELLIFKKNN